MRKSNIRCKNPILIPNKSISDYIAQHCTYLHIRKLGESKVIQKKLHYCLTSDNLFSQARIYLRSILDGYLECTTQIRVIDDSGRSYDVFKFVPCGHCSICNHSRINEYEFRALQEASNSLSSPLFVTLTYDEFSVPIDYSLNKEHIQKFFKRFRKFLKLYGLDNTSFRYAYCGEYGTKYTHRPHYHIVFFNLPIPDCVQSTHIVNAQTQQYKITTFYRNIIAKSWSVRCDRSTYFSAAVSRRWCQCSKVALRYNQYHILIGRTQCDPIKKNGIKYLTKYCTKQNNNYLINLTNKHLSYVNKYLNYPSDYVLSQSSIDYFKTHYGLLKLSDSKYRLVVKPFFRVSSRFGLSGLDIDKLRSTPDLSSLIVSDSWTHETKKFYISPYYSKYIFPTYSQMVGSNLITTYKKYCLCLILLREYNTPNLTPYINLYYDIRDVMLNYNYTYLPDITNEYLYDFAHHCLTINYNFHDTTQKGLALYVKRAFKVLASHFESFEKEKTEVLELTYKHRDYVQSILKDINYDVLSIDKKYQTELEKYISYTSDYINNLNI